jgi:hypothetical protein
MKQLFTYLVIVLALSISLYARPASAAGRHEANHAGLAAHAPGTPPEKIEGRVVAVMRTSRQITVRTPEGEIRQIRVPSDAGITGHDGNHFSAVRSGQHVSVTAVRDKSRGLVAKTLSVL